MKNVELTNFDEVIDNYLKSNNTPYALMIDGKWGVGKTWYIKNQFEEKFRKKVIYTSVNGLRSIDELSDQILYSKILKSKNKSIIQPAWRIIKQMSGPIINKWVGNFDSNKKLSKDILNLMAFHANEVLIIDDIERMTGQMKIEELLGYVSTNFTEANSYKVILVGDEVELNKKLEHPKNTSDYLRIKEKTIWQTVKYNADIEHSYNNILKSIREKKLKDVLEQNKTYIIGKFREYDVVNLRWLLYFFDTLRIMINSVDFSKYHQDQRIMDVILNSTIIKCIEYKKGNLNTNIDEDIPEFIQQNYPGFTFSAKPILKTDENIDSNPNIESDENIELKNKFALKYLFGNHQKYYFFESIYNLVCHGFFEEEEFRKNMESFGQFLDPNDEWDKAYKKLRRLLYLEEKDFIEEWNKMINYLHESKYGYFGLRNIAGLYERYSEEGIQFPTKRKEFYSILRKEMENCDEIESNITDEYFSNNIEKFKKNSEYADFMNIAAATYMRIKRKEYGTQISSAFDSFRETNNINKEQLLNIFNYGTESDVEKLTKIIFGSTTACTNFYHVFVDAYKDIVLSERHSLKGKINIEDFKEKCHQKGGNLSTILDWYAKKFIKMAEERLSID